MMTPTANHWPACMAPLSMNHLPRKPAVGGTPIMLRAPTAKAPIVHGMRRPMPLSSLTSVLCVAV